MKDHRLIGYKGDHYNGITIRLTKSIFGQKITALRWASARTPSGRSFCGRQRDQR